MAADALVDVLEDGFFVTDGNAPLEYTRNAALVQLAIDDAEKAFDRRDMRWASVGLSGSSPSIRYLRYGCVQVSLTAMTCNKLTTATSVSSFSGPSCPSGSAAPECSASSG